MSAGSNLSWDKKSLIIAADAGGPHSCRREPLGKEAFLDFRRTKEEEKGGGGRTQSKKIIFSQLLMSSGVNDDDDGKNGSRRPVKR